MNEPSLIISYEEGVKVRKSILAQELNGGSFLFD